MFKNLVIVESPTKAKTIEKYLGKHYQVVSCNGHVSDLPKNNKAIDIAHGFRPTYEVTQEKKATIAHLKKLSKSSDCIYLASDDDREGEAISWHLKEALDLTDAKIRRIVFREITKNAIQNALKNPRGIDIDLVDSQQARRVLDRLVGFELSPVLWKKIKTGLSAGRVQSVAVRLVVERERAIHAFNTTATFKVTALFLLEKSAKLLAELSEKFVLEKDALAFLEKCKQADFYIKNLEKKAVKRSPSAPFTTSTLQQEANNKLGYSVMRTMMLAQRLYESGKISYMRTDSFNLSAEAIASASHEINSTYGSNYFQQRKYKTKSASAQEAHEAIRPTDFSEKQASSDAGEQRLYTLIWKRAMASQMADAQLEKTTVTITISTTTQTFIARGEVVKFEGFLKVYGALQENEDNPSEKAGMLPLVTIGQPLALNHMQARETFSKPPARYAEASLVRQLEGQGIGRPSTYAPIIATIQKRGYVTKESREGTDRKYKLFQLKNNQITVEQCTEITGTEKNKLFSTDTAMIVNDFLVANFPNITDYAFTAKVEKELDGIAQGDMQWDKMLATFYQKFHPQVEKVEDLERATIEQSRPLGKDPATGKSIIARLGRYGPLVQIGEKEKGETVKFASLKKGQFIETITLEDALELFKLPRTLADFEDNPLIVAIGRFGPYIKHNNKFYSLGKEDDPYTIDTEKAIALIQAKRKADAEKVIKTFKDNPDIQILNGRWGPYIKSGKKNTRIPKDTEPTRLSLQACIELIEKAPDKKSKFKKS